MLLWTFAARCDSGIYAKHWFLYIWTIHGNVLENKECGVKLFHAASYRGVCTGCRDAMLTCGVLSGSVLFIYRTNF